MTERGLVLHVSDLMVKGHQTISDRRTPNGKPASALYALTRALVHALEHKVPAVAVAVVSEAPTDWPADLKQQLEPLDDLLRAHGVEIVRADRALDVVGAYARQLLVERFDVEVVGGDKRLAQLVGERVWWYEPFKNVRYTPDMVRKRFEVAPALTAQWLALVGDDDHLPGVKGIGKKGATTLLETYGSLESALACVDEIKGRTGNALRAAAEGVLQEVRRASIDDQIELPRALADLRYQTTTVETLDEMYRTLGFVELLSSLAGPAIELVICDDAEKARAAMQSLAPSVAVDLLTDDPSPVRGRLCGVAATSDGRQVFYFPGELAAPLLADAGVAKVGHDLKAAVVAFARRGVEVAGELHDTCCASHLHEPSNWAPQDLEVVARQVLGRALPDVDQVRGVGKSRKQWSELPSSDVGQYAGARAVAAWQIWHALEGTTDRTLLSEYMSLSAVLVRMELRGICVDVEDLRESGDDFAQINRELEAEIYALAGRSFNLGSTKQLGSVLFEDLKLPVYKRTKTGWSTATEALERIAHAHPIVSLVIRWRLLRRLTNTWVTALIACVDDDHRVRSTFHPARSFSGRLVNSHPDLGRVPGRTPEMQRIRHAFGVPQGYTLLSLDYHQLGLYVLAHLTGDPQLVSPLESGADMHRLTAAAVLDKPADQVDLDERQLGKVVNFATFAGQGANALGMQLGISAKDAKDYIHRFDQHYSVARAFQDEQLRLAQERGYIETIAGRHWPIGDLRSPDHMIRSYAERLARRATHEASVADVSRRGLLHADRALRQAGVDAVPLLQILDEVLFEVRADQVELAVQVGSEAMRTAFDMRVPLRVGAKAGPNWAELRKL